GFIVRAGERRVIRLPCRRVVAACVVYGTNAVVHTRAELDVSTARSDGPGILEGLEGCVESPLPPAHATEAEMRLNGERLIRHRRHRRVCGGGSDVIPRCLRALSGGELLRSDHGPPRMPSRSKGDGVAGEVIDRRSNSL